MIALSCILSSVHLRLCAFAGAWFKNFIGENRGSGATGQGLPGLCVVADQLLQGAPAGTAREKKKKRWKHAVTKIKISRCLSLFFFVRFFYLVSFFLPHCLDHRLYFTKFFEQRLGQL